MAEWTPDIIKQKLSNQGGFDLPDLAPPTRMAGDVPEATPEPSGFLGKLAGNIQQWASPQEAAQERLQFYGKQIADPVQATMMFAPGAMTAPQVTKRLRDVVRKAIERDPSKHAGTLMREADQLQKWVPQWLWDELEDIWPVDLGTVSGTYWGKQSRVKPKARGGIIQVDPKTSTSIGGTISHEVAHGLFDVLRKKTRASTGQYPKLFQRLDEVYNVHHRSYAIQQRIAEVVEDLKNTTLAMTDVKQIEKAAGQVRELQKLGQQSYQQSPEEWVARMLRKSFEKGEDFDSAVRGLLKSTTGAHNKAAFEASLDLTEKNARKIAGNLWDETYPVGFSRGPLKSPLAYYEFDRRTTGMPHYDNILHNPDYMRDKKGLVGDIVEMSPDEYIQKVAKGFKSTPEAQVQYTAGPIVDKYTKAHQRGDKFPTPVLDYSKKSFGQEGRHRALSAKAAGIEKIPVLVVKDAPDVVKGSTSKMIMPELKGALGREKIEKELMELAKKVSPENHELLTRVLHNYTVDELKAALERYKSFVQRRGK